MPDITEAKVFEAFGMTPPEEPAGAGAQVQEPAAPAAEGTQTPEETGAQEQEFAEPAENGADGEDGHSEPGAERTEEDADPGQNPNKQPLTPEERRANAARRRQQEQQAAIDKAVADALARERQQNAAQMEAFFKQGGFQNPETGQPVKSMEEFFDWQRKMQAQQITDDLKKGKLTAEQLDQLISTHPMVMQAQQIITQTQQAQAQQAEAVDNARIQSELAEIQKLDPSIKGVADLLAMPEAEAFRGYVAKGMGFLDAFKLSNMEKLAKARAEAAKQAALNNARGKDHLRGTGNPQGSGAVAATAEEMRMYRAFNPHATDAEIQAFHSKYKKS